MKTIIFRGDLEPEGVQHFINEIEQPNEEGKEYDIRIFFSCRGGEASMGDAIIDCINGLKKEYRIELIVTSVVASGAFDIFVLSKCKKKLYEGAHGLVHLLSQELSVREIVHPKKSYEKFLLDNLNDRNDKYLKWLESLGIFKKKELRRIARGKDVYLNRKRLQKIIDNQNTKKK